MIKFDHLRIPVRDAKTSRDWYVKNFGFTVEFENEWVTAIKDDADFTIFLYPTKNDLSGPKCGLVLQVQDVEAKYRQLMAAGVAFDKPPGKYFWGYGAELYDPDHYLVNLWDEVSMREKGGG